MKKKCGALLKFPNMETTKLRIDRIVPKDLHDNYKKQVNNFINKLQAESLQKCANESLKEN